MRSETVTSAQNPKIKELLSLQEKSRLRTEKGLFVVEGKRELEHCINAGYKIRTIFFCPQILPPEEFEKLLKSYKNEACNIVEIPDWIYDKVAYRGGTEGIIAQIYTEDRKLNTLKLPQDPLIVVIEGVEKPGNIGAVLRSADAAGVDAVIICDSPTDLYNPNLIRSSIGAIFTNNVISATSDEAIEWLKKNKIQILTAQLQDSSWYYDVDMTKGTAIVLGTEATGLTEVWRKAADAHIKIPMLGRLDSLNVSVSGAVLMYEATRQRKTGKKD